MTADPTPTSIIASLRARLDAVSDLADHLAGNEAAPLIREALNGYVPTGDLDPTPATGADQGGALTEADLSRYDETAAQMRDPERYAALMALTFDQRHPCPITGCRLSAEEHHRLAYGYLSENRALRQRVHDLEHGRVVDEGGEQR